MNKRLILLLLTVSTSAIAKTNQYDWAKNWYIGGGINGNSQFRNDLGGSPVMLHRLLGDDFTEVEEANYSVGFDVYIGRDVNKYWSTELGYTYVGNIRLNADVDDVLVGTVEMDQWNVHAVAVGKLAVAEYLNFFVKGGFTYFGSNQNFEAVDDLEEETDEIRTYTLTYGFGGEIVWDHWGIRGEYNVIWPANNVLDDFYVADLISANLYYKFF